MDHILIHCPVASGLWAFLFREAALSWVVSCKELHCERYSFLRGKEARSGVGELCYAGNLLDFVDGEE
jgi:hypothetical protein